MRRKGRLEFLLLLLMASLNLCAETFDGRVHSIVDGDTLIVLDGANRQRKLRLIGVDAPEISQGFGQQARTALSALAANQTVSADCRRDVSVELCIVRNGGVDLGLELVRAGMAWWNPAHSQQQTTNERADYQQAEFNAKIRRLGLWNSKNPEPPWQWRRGFPDD